MSGKDDLAHVTQPLLVLDHDTSLTLDARAAKLIRPAVRDVNGGVALQDVGLARTWDAPVGRIGFLSGVLQFGFEGEVTPLYTAQSGASVPKEDLRSWVNVKLAEPGPKDDFLNSPYVYHLYWGFTGTYPTGFSPLVEPQELAAVREHYHAIAAGKYGHSWTFGSTPDVPHMAATPLGVTLPFDRTEYYLADGRTWSRNFSHSSTRDFFGDLNNLQSAEETYVPGRTYVSHWNRGVFGPSFTPVGSPLQYTSQRSGNTINIHAPGYSDGTAGRYGYPPLTKSSRLALYRNGQLVAERGSVYDSAFLDQPAEEATYRAEMDLQIDESKLPLSNRTSTAWTFKSAEVSGTQPLPLMTVSVSPTLDSQNAAKANNLFVLPVRVQRNPGSAAARVAEVTIESSFDDGATWREVPVFPGEDIFYGLETNSAAPGFASLRVTATDETGGKVEQTFIHAYRIG
jgi:hypothetical protein